MQELSNPFCERAILSCLYHYGGKAFHEIEDVILDTNCFTIDSNKLIYSCLTKLINDDDLVKINLPIIFSTAKDLGIDNILCKKDEIDHLKAIINLDPNFDNLRGFAKKIRKLQITRQIKTELRLANDKLSNITGDEQINEILSIPENSILGFSSLINDDNEAARLIGRNTDELVEYLANNPVSQIGVDVGFPRWQEMIGGADTGVHVIASRSNQGKSILASCFALNLAKKHNIKTLILDTEMTEEQCQYRLLANLSGVSINKIKTGQFGKNKAEFLRVEKAAKDLKNIPYYYRNVSDKPSLDEHVSLMRRFIHKEVGLTNDHRTANKCLIIYDYLKILSGGKSLSSDEKEYQIIGNQMGELHNLSIKYNFPLITFVQINRQGINATESTDIISQSDRILWLATSLSAMWDKSPEQISEDGIEAGNMILTILKARHGMTTKFGDYICMQKTGHLARIKELKTKLELQQNPHDNTQSGFIVDSQDTNANYNELRDSFADAEDVIPK